MFQNDWLNKKDETIRFLAFKAVGKAFIRFIKTYIVLNNPKQEWESKDFFNSDLVSEERLSIKNDQPSLFSAIFI